MEKRCHKCKVVKPLVEFHKLTKSKDGYQAKCKECKKQYHLQNKDRTSLKNKQRYQENKEEIKKRSNQYYHENKEEIKKRNKEYYLKNADSIKSKVKKWRIENLDYVKWSKKHHYEEHKDKILHRNKEYYQDNKDKILQRNKKYRIKNSDRVKENKSKYHQRRKNDPIYKYSRILRGNIWSSYKRNGYNKSNNTEKILGCTLIWFFEEWLSNKYNPPKTHIDHIVPVSLSKTKDEVYALNHFSNMQVLDANDNLSKNNKYVSLAGLSKVLANHPNPTLVKKIVSRSKIEIK